MKELNINILSAYLPYTLDKVQLITKDGRRGQLDGIANANIAYFRQGNHVTEEYIPSLKLVLRSLFELFNDSDVSDNKAIKVIDDNIGGYYDVWINRKTLNITIKDSHPESQHIPFWAYNQIREELLHDKFDVFGLIDKGLAIPADSNTYTISYLKFK